MKATMRVMCALATCFLAGIMAACSHPKTEVRDSWNQKAAATYLDQREGSWMAWPQAARDHGTFCVSCHTAVPYALARPTLRAALAERTPSVNERKLISDVRKRVRLWQEVAPYYRDDDAESRGTEAVLNALILANYDTRKGQLSADTRSAFDAMWALQLKIGNQKGAWPWLQLNNEPWEAYDSEYYGASLAAIAVGTAPENYRSTPEIQNNIKLLCEYLDGEYATQILVNRVVLLWASAKLPGLLKPEQQESVINEILRKQRADGGWCLSSLIGTWERRDGTSLVMKSDGYATGLITYVLQEVGVSRDNVHLKDGLSWLMRNQSDWNGHWSAYSLNERRHDPFSNVARFMDDAATAYAVLALTDGQQESNQGALRFNR
ncbi:MAG: prenyltransferase/squalene oxidase repeat-containing protein [Candidatus Acidiferrales bacterium]